MYLFYKCITCDGIFRPKHTFLSADAEKEHYEKHNNDVLDERYQAFVSPIVEAVLHDFSPESSGLDFGSGTGPVIAKMLTDKGYQVQNYDLFFANDLALLKQKYDYVRVAKLWSIFSNRIKNLNCLKVCYFQKGNYIVKQRFSIGKLLLKIGITKMISHMFLFIKPKLWNG